VELKAAENCLDHAIIITIAKVEDNADYKTYVQGRKIRPVVQKLLAETGIFQSEGGEISELIKFQDTFASIR
jgi:hypothetical protein